jgi:hypothetical protein
MARGPVEAMLDADPDTFRVTVKIDDMDETLVAVAVAAATAAQRRGAALRVAALRVAAARRAVDDVGPSLREAGAILGVSPAPRASAG